MPPFVDWAFLDAVWRARLQGLPRQPRAPAGRFIAEKHRFILFGTYPYEQHWRPALATRDPDRPVGVFRASACSGGGGSLLVWLVGLVADRSADVGRRVRPAVRRERALGRADPDACCSPPSAWRSPFRCRSCSRSGGARDMPVIRALCVGYIELIRGVPLISVLFMASVMLPLFLPCGRDDRQAAARADRDLILFAAAYLAEVVRGGLQAIPQGQYEAARGARPALLAAHLARHPAAGAAHLDPAAGQHLHRRCSRTLRWC